MVSVSKLSFNDPDAYFSGIRTIKGGGFLLSERGLFGAELTLLNFDHLRV
jgi:hypothetical protein